MSDAETLEVFLKYFDLKVEFLKYLSTEGYYIKTDSLDEYVEYLGERRIYFHNAIQHSFPWGVSYHGFDFWERLSGIWREFVNE